MKITIWIHKSEAISGNITNYAFSRPYHDRMEEWVQVQISQDEFVRLEDNQFEKVLDEECKQLNLFRDEEQFLVDQYNRNRELKDHIKDVSEMPSKLQHYLSNPKF